MVRNFKRLFLGFFLTFLSAWIGLVVVPVRHFAQQKRETAPVYVANESLVRRGEGVYISNGCIYCHSQQVRPAPFADDIDRGWGDRRTTPEDYLHDQRALMGTMRTGPDLANIGARQTSTSWHFQHLYDPRSVSPGSIMPPFRFLFEKKPIASEPEADALVFHGSKIIGGKFQIVPTADGRALVAYLLSLRRAVSPPVTARKHNQSQL
jgi:cytochrome c oxidase cbb3-type subunit 2